MKKTIYILSIIFSLLFVACSDKENIFLQKQQPETKKENIKKEKEIVQKPIEQTKIKQNETHTVKKIVAITPIKIEKKIEIKKKVTVKNNKKQNSKLAQPIKESCESNVEDIDKFKFDIIKKGTQDNNTFLIVGGIQGDEPGGFMAASLVSTHYEITKGSVWIVPNLNFYSIIKRSRGPFGDMNRKFAKLSKNDPEYKTVQRIKKYIRDKHVKLILNLHDGSGFYRPKYIDRWHQPLTWGQSSVIDQKRLKNVKNYSNTYEISEKVVNHINKYLLKKEDKYRTKNTHTKFNKTHEEQEMAKTLTYYAVTHGKAAFGHETSKSLNVAQRVYYKILAIEKYMDIMGIKYKRKFPLTLNGVNHALNDDISITFNDTNIKIPLKNIRNIQKYFPIKKDGIVTYLPSNPLIKIIKKDNVYTIYYGNRRLTRLVADYSEHLNFNTKIKLQFDGKEKQFSFGDTINVKKQFKVIDERKFRVNVIGYKNKSGIETNINITKHMFMKRYSIEKNGNIYRVEFYKKKRFVGMILINYTG